MGGTVVEEAGGFSEFLREADDEDILMGEEDADGILMGEEDADGIFVRMEEFPRELDAEEGNLLFFFFSKFLYGEHRNIVSRENINLKSRK